MRARVRVCGWVGGVVGSNIRCADMSQHRSASSQLTTCLEVLEHQSSSRICQVLPDESSLHLSVPVFCSSVCMCMCPRGEQRSACGCALCETIPSP